MVCGKTFQNWKCEPQGRHRIPGGTEAPGNEIHPGDITKPWRWDVLTYAFLFAVPYPLPEGGFVVNAKILGRRGHLFSLDQAVFWTYAWLQDCHNEYGTHKMLQAASLYLCKDDRGRVTNLLVFWLLGHRCTFRPLTSHPETSVWKRHPEQGDAPLSVLLHRHLSRSLPGSLRKSVPTPSGWFRNKSCSGG